uniref:Uncharacterized protein n=1 Tax=Steinernema glaseri TaxID=37863 RepID=A0A1I8A167_9BILA
MSKKTTNLALDLQSVHNRLTRRSHTIYCLSIHLDDSISATHTAEGETSRDESADDDHLPVLPDVKSQFGASLPDDLDKRFLLLGRGRLQRRRLRRQSLLGRRIRHFSNRPI